MSPHDPPPAPLHPERLTWAALLGRWVDFAQSAVALPATPQGARLRESVPDLIMLQALWFAFGELDGFDPAERALGVDRAEMLIEKHTTALLERWRHAGLPVQVRELIGDARAALARASASRA